MTTTDRVVVPRELIQRHWIPNRGKGSDGSFELRLHGDATILSVQEMRNDLGDWQLCVFALANPRLPIEMRTFMVYGAGDPVRLPPNGLWSHVASVQSRAGMVWHVFEVWA